MFHNKKKYYSIILGSFAAFELLMNMAVKRGFDLPVPDEWNKGQWIVDARVLNFSEWKIFSRRNDVIIALTFVFVTAGPNVTLPSDFNTANNTIHGIGAAGSATGGATGQHGNNSGGCCVANGGGGGAGGNGAGAGAYA